MRHTAIGVVIRVLVVLSVSSCSSPVREVKEVSSEPVTAILGAFEKEIIMLEDELTDTQEQRIEGMRFVSGKLNGKRVVIAWTGIGKVNAAMTATLLIEHFRPSELLFTGIAGGINPQLRPGDIVIAAETAHHDMGVLTPQSFDYRGAMNPLGADAVEMEGAAVAQICYQRRIPHLVIRSISDKADEGAVLDKHLFQMVAAKNSASLVAEIIGLLDRKKQILNPKH